MYVVTTPKLLPPPLIAANISALVVLDAVIMVPLGKTISTAAKLLAAQPYWVLRNESPPPSRYPPTPTLPLESRGSGQHVQFDRLEYILQSESG